MWRYYVEGNTLVIRKISILICMVLIQGCNITSRDTGGNSTGTVGTCQPYDTTSINVEVKDSILELPINSSHVTIHVKNNDSSIFEANFERERGTDTYSYFSDIDIDSAKLKFDILVTDPDYHSSITKNITFTVNRECNAKNNIRYDVYLCPAGSSCL